MIQCSVCGAENGDLEVVCGSCRSYLQAKIDTLDLFATAWGLIESPVRTMRRVALARRKNYVILLSALGGVALVLAVLWLKTLGPALGGLEGVLVTSLAVGLLLGPAVAVGGTLLGRLVLKMQGVRATFRNLYAVLAYALVPVVLSLVLVFPVELALFGQYLFDQNPPPMSLNPAAYVLLLGMDGVCAVWATLLLVIGIRAAGSTTSLKAGVAGLVILGCLAGGVLGVLVMLV
jgi:hypothetical protein